MRILFSISNLKIGGAQTFLVRLLETLSLRHTVFLYQLSNSPEDDRLLTQIPSKVKILSSNSKNFWHLIFSRIDKIFFRQLFKRLHFRNIIAVNNIEIINSHLFHSDSFVTNSISNKNIPVVITDHGDYRSITNSTIRYSNPLIKILIKAKKWKSKNIAQKIFTVAKGVIYLSDDNYRHIIDLIKPNNISKKIYNGYLSNTPNISSTAKRRLLIPDDSFVFGMVARGIPDKGWAEAINAVKIIRGLINKDVHLILVGESNYLSSLRASLVNSDKSFTHFVGFSSKPSFWIESFDVGLLPTYFVNESLPNSIIEYLAHSKPVITTNIGGIKEMLVFQGKIAGQLISLNPSGRVELQSLVTAMQQYLNNPALLKEQSELAKLAFQKFSLETCATEYEQFFSDIKTTHYKHRMV
jgi:L-malate glycosyltransferase